MKNFIWVIMCFFLVGCKSATAPGGAFYVDKSKALAILEEDCKNNEYILSKNQESHMFNKMEQFYACKYNTKEYNVIIVDGRAKHVPVKSIDGKTYTLSELEQRSESDPSFELGRVISRSSKTVKM